MANAAIQTLRRLQPDSGEAHLALAKHLYWGYLDYDRARQELAAAQGALPNDSDCLLLLGYIDRRQGRWEASLKEMEHARTLDPRNVLILKQIGLTHRQLRRYSDVIAVFDRALQLDPNDLAAGSYRARVDLEQHANIKPLHMHVETFLAQNPKAPQQISNDLVDLALFERDPAMAERTLSGLSYSYGAESVAFPRAWCDGRLALLRGDAAAAKVAFTEARKQLERTVREQPNNAAALIALGMVDAALGQKKDAIREGRRAIELSPVSKDAIDGALFMEYLAAIYTMNGEIDNAVNQLEATAKLPGDLNYGGLQLDPIWDPLRRDPRFDKIVASLAPK
jgi:tetratricopeptide (TPR) repeat protein